MGQRLEKGQPRIELLDPFRDYFGNFRVFLQPHSKKQTAIPRRLEPESTGPGFSTQCNLKYSTSGKHLSTHFVQFSSVQLILCSYLLSPSHLGHEEGVERSRLELRLEHKGRRLIELVRVEDKRAVCGVRVHHHDRNLAVRVACCDSAARPVATHLQPHRTRLDESSV